MLRVAIYLIGILFLISTADLIASGPTQQPGNVNRKQAADTVAQAFERTRASAMLPALERIPAQKSMTQLLCTTALTGQKTFDPDSLYGEGALYRTSVLSKVTPELQHAALTRAFNGNGRPRRYAVAVWEARDHTPERPDFWVSVELYDTAFHDWVALRFTTDRLFGLGLNDWKRLVIPPCGAVE